MKINLSKRKVLTLSLSTTALMASAINSQANPFAVYGITDQQVVRIAIAIGVIGIVALVLAIVALVKAGEKMGLDDYNNIVGFIDQRSEELNQALEAALQSPKAQTEENNRSKRTQQDNTPTSLGDQPPLGNGKMVKSQATDKGLRQGYFSANEGDSFVTLTEKKEAETLFRVDFGNTTDERNGLIDYIGTLEDLRTKDNRLIGTSVLLKDNGVTPLQATRFIVTHKGQVARMNKQWVILTPVVLQLA